MCFICLQIHVARATAEPSPPPSAATARAQEDEAALLAAALLADDAGLRAAEGAALRTLQASVQDWAERHVLYVAKQEQARSTSPT